MQKSRLLVGLLALAGSLGAALTEEQRVQDFQAVAALFAKSYAPANWKILALGVNLFETAPWERRVRAAKNDLEHVKVLMEYVGSLQDTHSQLTLLSNFYADLGFYCDVYDGKVILDSIDRALLPLARYPFRAGDEFVSLDGRPVLEIARELSREQGWGNPRAALRAAVGRVTFRQQWEHALAVDLPNTSTVVIKRQSGEVETYQIPWDKVGYAVRDLGAAPTPHAMSSGIALKSTDEATPESEPLTEERTKRFYAKRVSKVADSRVFRKESMLNEDGTRSPHLSLRGFGATAPVWTVPTGFVQRLGRSSTDAFFTGTYVSQGKRIGFLRLKDFLYLTNAQLNQLATEIVYFNNNTDGLVVDVMRNRGGYDCAVVETAAMLIPRRFEVDGVSIRPSLSWINYFDQLLLESEFYGDPQYVIDTYTFHRDLVISAYGNGRSMTGSIPSCSLGYGELSYSFAYTKPLIVLIDDFSTSAGDMFPAMIQDNGRAKLVGMRTNGAGGNVRESAVGSWSESYTTFTESIVMRRTERTVEGFPRSPFIENVGVRPDVTLDFMTVDNVLTNGRPFVEAFTKIIVDEILAAQQP